MLVSDLVLQYLQAEPAHQRLPLKRQLFSALRRAIMEQRLPAETRLPPSRDLARDLGFGRNTVLRAYEQLLAEGYAFARQGSGTYVADTLPEARPAGRPKRWPTAVTAVRLSARGAVIAAHSNSSKLQYGAFMPGIPDVRLFPHTLWRRLIGKYMTRDNSRLMHYAAGGYGPLKAALAEHLRVSRLISCDPRQILIVGGAHQGLDLIARMLSDPADTAWVEDPGYWGASNVLRAAGLAITPIGVDNDGISPQESDWDSPPRLIFTSPSYQYPTGAVLSLARRRMLLERANRCDAWIIEDDYDNELRYHREPLTSLFGLAPANRVIYVGTFSKVMYPGLRLGYLVVPPLLVDAFSIGNAELFREGRLVEQAAVAEFIAEGHLDSHIRRMRLVYAERQAVLRERLARHLGDELTTSGGQAGIHLLYRFKKQVDDERVAHEALSAGVIVRPLSLYYQNPLEGTSGLVLGYAGVSTDHIPAATDRLAAVAERHLIDSNSLCD